MVSKKPAKVVCSLTRILLKLTHVSWDLFTIFALVISVNTPVSDCVYKKINLKFEPNTIYVSLIFEPLCELVVKSQTFIVGIYGLIITFAHAEIGQFLKANISFNITRQEAKYLINS